LEIGRIENCTRTLGQPIGWNAERDGPCVGLPIRDEMHGGSRCMVSAWIPTPDELAALVAGAPIYLRVIGTSHPPVCVYVGEAPG